MVITEIQKNQTPENIFAIAVEYDYSANLLLRNFGNNKMVAMNPILFNQAFALELYFKCLIYLTKGKKASKTHELKKLYSQLNKKDKTQIELIFESKVFIKRIKKGARQLRGRRRETNFKPKPNFSYEIEEILTFSNFSVIEHRYPFDSASKRYYGINYLTQAVLEYIIQLKPDWKSKTEPLNLIF